VKMFDAGKTRMIELPYGEKNCDNMLSRFHLIPERYGQTDRRTDGQNCYINIARECDDARYKSAMIESVRDDTDCRWSKQVYAYTRTFITALHFDSAVYRHVLQFCCLSVCHNCV